MESGGTHSLWPPGKPIMGIIYMHLPYHAQANPHRDSESQKHELKVIFMPKIYRIQLLSQTNHLGVIWSSRSVN